MLTLGRMSLSYLLIFAQHVNNGEENTSICRKCDILSETTFLPYLCLYSVVCFLLPKCVFFMNGVFTRSIHSNRYLAALLLFEISSENDCKRLFYKCHCLRMRLFVFFGEVDFLALI